MSKLAYLAQMTHGYWAPTADPLSSEPDFVGIEMVYASGATYTAVLPPDKLNDHHLCNALPQLRSVGNRSHIINDLNHQYVRNLTAGTLQHGIYFSAPGFHRLPDGVGVYLWGNCVLGNCNFPYYKENSEQHIPHSAPIANPLQHLMGLLAFAAPQVLLAIVFLLTTLNRSWIKTITPSGQAVLNIVGGQGLGKTTLAKRLTDWIQDSDGAPALLFSAGSTPSAIRDAMIDARDLPMVIDDLCLAASPQLQRKYRDLGAQFVREGANDASIVKKLPGGKSLKQKCNAGIILTAEFALENASDITRCIFVNVDKPLKLPSSISSELVGAACEEFIRWFLAHESLARDVLTSALCKEPDPQFHQRIWNNFTVLNSMFELLLHAASDAGISAEASQGIRMRYNQAINDSLGYQNELLKQLDRQMKKANLAAILLQAYEQDAFHLTSRIEKLEKRDGIIWRNDLCLRREPLERLIRAQDGYGNHTISRIVQELKDIGALVIQESGTAQVYLKKNFPRVYRVRLNVLRHYAKEF